MIYLLFSLWMSSTRGPSSIILSAVIHLCKKDSRINPSFLRTYSYGLLMSLNVCDSFIVCLFAEVFWFSFYINFLFTHKRLNLMRYCVIIYAYCLCDQSKYLLNITARHTYLILSFLHLLGMLLFSILCKLPFW